MGEKGTPAKVREFLASDLSRLKERYEARFTRRLSYDSGSILPHEQDDLDRQIQSWAATKGLGDVIPHIIRSQPYENAQRVFEDLRQMVGVWESPPKVPASIARRAATTYDLNGLMAIFAMADMFAASVSFRWLFETLRFFWPVDVVAQWLHTLFPEYFFPISADLFWRTDRLRRYCEGLGINVDWPGVDGSAMEAYWEVDAVIRSWADDANMSPWELWAVFDHLAPRLFPDESGPLPNTRRTWIAMSSDQSFAGLDDEKEETQTWTSHAGVRRGDSVLMYCMAPRKAITHRFRVMCDAFENAFDDTWTDDRVWTELSERESVPWITLDEMRADRVLSSWGIVRSNFQGARRAAVPDAIQRRIEELIEKKRSNPNWVQRAVGHSARTDGRPHTTAGFLIPPQEEAELEREFEDRAVKPLLQQLGVDLVRRSERQKPIRMYVGSRRVTNRADFVLFADDDRQEPSVVIETKRSIDGPEQLAAARQQAESYAGYLRVPTFAVIAPQGIWVYELAFPGQSNEVATYSLEEAARQPKRTLLARALGPHR